MLFWNVVCYNICHEKYKTFPRKRILDQIASKGMLSNVPER